jgi:hypothetical protein
LISFLFSLGQKENESEGQHYSSLQVFTFYLLSGSAATGKYAISLRWLALFTDQFTFEDSLPRHARAGPMNPIT